MLPFIDSTDYQWEWTHRFGCRSAKFAKNIVIMNINPVNLYGARLKMKENRNKVGGNAFVWSVGHALKKNQQFSKSLFGGSIIVFITLNITEAT